MLDKYGKCPCCKKDWKGEDILSYLKKMSMFLHLLPKELDKIAELYGYTKENPTFFSNVIEFEIENNLIYQCSDIKCKKLFDVKTSENIPWKEGTSLLTNILKYYDKSETKTPIFTKQSSNSERSLQLLFNRP